MDTIWKKETVADVVNLVIGAGLFLSPWVFGFATEMTAGWNAWLSGMVIAGLAIAALSAYAEWEEWLTLAVGAWVAASPWIVAFHANLTATWVHLAAGAGVAVIAAARIWSARRGRWHATA